MLAAYPARTVLRQPDRCQHPGSALTIVGMYPTAGVRCVLRDVRCVHVLPFRVLVPPLVSVGEADATDHIEICQEISGNYIVTIFGRHGT